MRWVTAPPLELAERRRMRQGDPNNSLAINMNPVRNRVWVGPDVG
ncbi:MAG: hypothetical protein ACE5Q6_22925 [Dehalococcoidia bacterium]